MMHRDAAGEQRTKRRREAIVELLGGEPAAADRALIVVNGDEKQAAILHQWRYVSERIPHLSGVMENAPGVDDIELAEAAEVFAIEGGGAFYAPAIVIREIARAQLGGAAYGIRIEIEGMYGCAQAPGRETEQTAD